MVVYYLMLNKNKVINRDKLINDIWGTDVIVIDRTIDVHIRKIRKRLSDNINR
jgi:two-component system alkaline phosphatase synthesis response regulator PhoP